jgi:hypothetical protein
MWPKRLTGGIDKRYCERAASTTVRKRLISRWSMATTAQSEYSPIPADPEKLDSLLRDFADTCGIQLAEVSVSASYQFEDGGSDRRTIEPSAISVLVPVARPIALIALRNDLQDQRLYIWVSEDHVTIQAEADTMSSAKDLVEGAVACLGLTPYAPPAQERVVALEKRLDAVQALQQEDVHLRCFLSFRFNPADEVLAAQVERFLQLQGVEVLTGLSYEPRKVEDKVRSLLAQALDFLVLLLTSSGDSSWLRDEIAEARTAEVPVIPLVEDGVEFKQGLFGNVEQIPFSPGHIGDVWISLTEALEFIRATRRHAVNDEDELTSES